MERYRYELCHPERDEYARQALSEGLERPYKRCSVRKTDPSQN
jgi:hypothetical protein